MSSPKSPKKTTVNSFEQLTELGKDIAHKAVEDVPKALIPLPEFGNPTKKEQEKGNDQFSPVDFAKLQESYDKQDNPQLQKIREQLSPEQAQEQQERKLERDYHDRVKTEEEKILRANEKEEEEEQRQEAIEKQQKEQAEEEEKKKQQQGDIPKGKVRKSILGGKSNRKSTTELPPELKPGAGKQ